MLYENNYQVGNSWLHRAHPVIKFIIFLLIIFLLFAKISVFVHLSLTIITIFIVYLSQNFKFIFKKIFIFYAGIFLFLMIVNWVFNKNPGFWSEEYVNNTYRNIFEFTKTPTKASKDTIKHGWFLGGEIINENSSIKNDVLDKMKEFAVSSHAGKKVKYFGFFSAVDETTKYVAFIPRWYTLTQLQMLHAWNMTNKLMIVVTLSTLLTMTTRLSDLSYALEDIFKPLKIFKLPVEELALIISLSLRFIPTMVQETFRIIKAQASRGIDFKNGKLKDRISAITASFVPLFIISIIKSDELSTAMIARAYKTRNCRTNYRVHSINKTSLFIFGFFIFVLSLLYHLHTRNFVCKTFDSVEYLLLITK